MEYRKKLIEVALPLDAINRASAREKSIRHGHPSTLHLWWARRPLAAARAVIFAQMVDDPSTYVDELLADPAKKHAAQAELRRRREAWRRQDLAYADARRRGDHDAVHEPGPEPTLEECAADLERQRLFALIEELVQWESTTNEKVIERAREEVRKSWRRTCRDNADHPRAAELFDPNKLPAFHDPFAGGGSLPLEAQRLGLKAYASDLNPVAVLINKAMIEIPPRFAGRPPVNPKARSGRSLFRREWKGAQGLAEDLRYYGKWMRDEAEKRIGHLYPKVSITPELVRKRPDLKKYEGKELTVIAWLWARTVQSPNPAFAHLDVPLASTFVLATKRGKEAYIEPVIEDGSYRFSVRPGTPKDLVRAKSGTRLGSGATFRCLMSGTPIPADYIRTEGRAGRIRTRLMAVVAEGDRGRVYLDPIAEHEAAANAATPRWQPDVEFFQHALGFRVGGYGMTRWSDLFTSRQTVALQVFTDLIHHVHELVKRHATACGMTDDGSLSSGAHGATAYADAIALYLAFAVDKCAVYWNSLCPWLNQPKNEIVGNSFSRQTVQMVWDFAEANPFCDSGGNIVKQLNYISRVLGELCCGVPGIAEQADAASQRLSAGRVISCDPPYYDNIGYADLSDFFYVWLRRAVRPLFPELFGTLVVPKAEELVATPHRHGGRDAAESFFLSGMTKVMHRLAEQMHPAFPVTIYYAFRQSETRDASAASTGWETFLEAVIRAGLRITGTWPVRTERPGRMRDTGSNALASSIVLVARRRPEDAPVATRGEFTKQLKAGLPPALRDLQHGNIAPADLAQAAIGPGMAVFTRWSKVVDAAGNPLSVRDALALINQVVDEVLAEQEGEFDAETRWALAWFEQHGFTDGQFGVAETLSKAKNTAVDGLVEAGIVASRAGKVRLLRPAELPRDWDPATDPRLTVWEMVHHLIRVLQTEGEAGAAKLVARLGTKAETAREVAYRLYTVCERKNRAQEALSYNVLVQSWPEIVRLAQGEGAPAQGVTQGGLFEEE